MIEMFLPSIQNPLPPAAGDIPTPEGNPPAGGFLQALNRYFAGVTGEKTDPEGQTEGKADSALMTVFLDSPPTEGPCGIYGQPGGYLGGLSVERGKDSSFVPQVLPSAPPISPCQDGFLQGDQVAWVPEGTLPPGLSSALPMEKGPPFFSSGENLETSQQGWKSAGIEPVQELVPETRPQSGEGDLFSVPTGKGTSSDFPFIPDQPADSKAFENRAPSRIGPTGPPVVNKEGLNPSGTQEPAVLEAFSMEGAEKQPPPGRPFPEGADEASSYPGVKFAGGEKTFSPNREAAEMGVRSKTSGGEDVSFLNPPGKDQPFPKAIDEAPVFSGMKFTGVEKPSSPAQEAGETGVRSKAAASEEGPALNPQGKDQSSYGPAWQSPTPGHGEKEGFPFSAFRPAQVFPPGKESQNSFGLYGTSTDASASTRGFVEFEGKAAPAPGRFEPQGIYQQVGERVLWLIRNQEEKIRIFLDPPELGRLHLEIHRSRDSIQALLLTGNPEAKAALESSQMEIQRIIEREGFKLEKFDVLMQQDWGRFQEGRESGFRPHFRYSFFSGKERDFLTAPAAPLDAVPRRMHPASRYLDLFV